jgi:hypothetical protein
MGLESQNGIGLLGWGGGSSLSNPPNWIGLSQFGTLNVRSQSPKGLPSLLALRLGVTHPLSPIEIDKGFVSSTQADVQVFWATTTFLFPPPFCVAWPPNILIHIFGNKLSEKKRKTLDPRLYSATRLSICKSHNSTKKCSVVCKGLYLPIWQVFRQFEMTLSAAATDWFLLQFQKEWKTGRVVG